MHTEILTAPQLAVLEGLTAVPAVREFYLAGRTALALRHGHRRSIDFDFFRETPFDVQGFLLGSFAIPIRSSKLRKLRRGDSVWRRTPTLPR